MSNEASHKPRVCPECAATVHGVATHCWMCQRKFDEVCAPVAPAEAVAPPPGGTIRPTFGIASLMLTVTLIAVVLGVTRMNVVLGIGLAVLVTPAFIRTALAAARDRDRGQRMSVPEKVAAFVASLGVVTAVGAASGAAFFATCFGSFWGVAVIGESTFSGYDWIFILLGVAAILGAAAAITVAVFLLKRLWPRRR